MISHMHGLIRGYTCLQWPQLPGKTPAGYLIRREGDKMTDILQEIYWSNSVHGD